MSWSKGVPDAWDDDWVDNATAKDVPTEHEQPPPKKLSKAERRKQQFELNKKLWDDAEAPETPYLVQRTNDVPLQSGFAPQMKVLSRKPVTLARKNGPLTAGMQQLSVAGGPEDDDDEEEEEDKRRAQASAEERAERAKREREEKQRKYDEVRQRLFGSSGEADGGQGSTKQASSSSSSSATGGRGGGGNGGGGSGRGRARGNAGSARSTPGRQLFDPNVPSRNASASSSGTATPVGDVPVRTPRGPDGSGKGGRGFTQPRGRDAAQ